ncbi:MAG: superinfection exclusion B family protein [Acidobacteriia bacterium]|nr:superinfection exclusion B family protein [Terriglobia bacterium]
MPAPLWQHAGLCELIATYKPWLWVVFLFSFLVLITYPLGWCYSLLFNSISGHFVARKNLRQSISKLQNLSSDEREILGEFLAKGVRTLKFLPSEGVISPLVYDGILVQSSKVGNLVEGFAFTLTDWSWNYLLEHPECVGMSKQDLKK